MYFNISTTIVDRTDLSINEKMACVVMSRYANNPAFEGLLSLEIIATKMGVEIAQAKEAMVALKQKGLIENDLELTEKKNVIKNGEDVKTIEFKPLVDKELSNAQKKEVPIDEIRDIFEEIVPKNRAKILYGLADRNLELLKKAYKVVQKDCKFDAIEALADFLQRKGNKSALLEEKKSIEKGDNQIERPLPDEEAEALLEILEKEKKSTLPSDNKINHQINMSKIKHLYKSKNTKR